MSHVHGVDVAARLARRPDHVLLHLKKYFKQIVRTNISGLYNLLLGFKISTVLFPTQI